jgi:hypothetical protein
MLRNQETVRILRNRPDRMLAYGQLRCRTERMPESRGRVMKAKGVAIITRTLREGKTFDDYRKAWYHTHGFGVPTNMLTVINIHNPRQIISIGIMEIDDIERLPSILQIDIKERLANPLDDVIENEIVRQFGIIVSEDDFSMAGKIPPKPPTVNGEEVHYSDMEEVIRIAAKMFTEAAEERDRLWQDAQ